MVLDFKAKLLGLVDSLLAGERSFEEFAAAYSDCFIEEMPDDALTESELVSFGTVHEKAEWTGPNPSMEERSFGWLDQKDFVNWLNDYRQSLG